MLILIVIGLLVRKRAPGIAVGLAVLLICTLPYCPFVYIYHGKAERFTYLAAIGFVLTVVTEIMLATQLQRRALLCCIPLWTF